MKSRHISKIEWYLKQASEMMFHLQRFFSMEQAPPPVDDGADECFSATGEPDSTSAEG